MSNDSRILPAAVGNINKKEEVTSAFINCSKEEVSDVKDIFKGLKFDVIYPYKAKEAKKVPLIGGSIGRVTFAKDLQAQINNNTSKEYQTLLARINQNLSIVEKYTNEVAGDPLAKSIDKYSGLIVKINNSLNNIRFYKKGLYKFSIPSIGLSIASSAKFQTYSDLNSALSAAAETKTRLAELKNVGNFKFIPFETILQIYKIITGDSEGYFASNIGLSGESFVDLYERLIESPTEEDIAKAILNIFPILRINEDIIIGEDSQDLIGYYTVWKNFAYIKMPDLSGRDSAGYSTNPYGLGLTREEGVNFALEFSIRKNYKAVSFDYQAPPQIQVEESEFSFGDLSGIEIPISREGFYQDQTYTFFLSPIVSGKRAIVKGVPRIKEDSNAFEYFVAPNLAVPFYSEGKIAGNNLKPIIELDKEKLILNQINYSYRDYNLDSFEQQTEEILGNDSFLSKSYINSLIENKNYYSKENGPILSGDHAALGISSSSQLLGNANRPDVFIGTREGSGRLTYDINDEKYWSDSICSAKEFFMSITPNILREEQIPSFWIKGGDLVLSDDGGARVSFPQSGISRFLGIQNLNKKLDLSFALYALDSLGQLTRVPGPNILLSPPITFVQNVTPDGFRQDGIIINDPANIPDITVSLEEEEDLESIKFYLSEDAELPIGELSNLEYIKNVKEITISIGNKLLEIVGRVSGTYWIQINNSNRVPIYLAPSDLVQVTDLPMPPEASIRFEDTNGLSAKGFGKELDSIPILLDGKNAEINLKYNKKIFKNNSDIYLYFAILNNENNKRILIDDIGLSQDGGLSGSGLVTVTGIGDGNYIIPSKMSMKLGDGFLQYLSSNKLKVLFPGPFLNLNISRFSELTASETHPAAYIILSNKEISNVDSVTFSSGEWAQIPVGNTLSSSPEERKAAFIDPPHIYGMIAKLSNSNNSVVSTIRKEALDGLYFEKIKGVSYDQINSKNIAPIITTDSLSRLAVIFRGSSIEAKKSKQYSVLLDGELLDERRAGRVKDLGNNLLVANFKNIKTTKIGWLDLSVQKEDRRYNVSYDSTVYDISSILFDSDNDKDFFVNEDILSEPNRFGDYYLAGNKDKRFFREIDAVRCSKTSSLFKEAGIYFPSPVPNKQYPPDDQITSCDSNILENISSFAYFANPIEVYPDADIKVGSPEGVKQRYGLFATDTNREKYPSGEYAKIDKDGKISYIDNLSDLEIKYEQIISQSSDEKQKLEERISKLEREIEAATKEQDTSEKKQEITRIKEKIDYYDKRQEEASQALETLRISLNEGGEVSPSGAALEDANTAIEALEGSLLRLSPTNDKLSSITFDEELGADGSLRERRGSSFTGINIRNIFLSKDAIISKNWVHSNDQKTFYRLNLRSRFGKTSVIKFNSPEIISITTGPGNIVLPENFSQIKLGESGFSNITINVAGLETGSKVEINEVRIPYIKISEDGPATQIKLKIDSKEVIELVGSNPCTEIKITNSNKERITLSDSVDNDLSIDITGWDDNIGGGLRSKNADPGDTSDSIERNALRFTSVKLEESYNKTTDFLQSFCDLSYNLTGELTMHLRSFKVLLVPIKVIFCIIDVICALLNPVKLAFAVIRLFLCLYDLALLLPQVSVPAMLLSILLHILELTLCLIVKVLGVVNAINEIITAIDLAASQNNYKAIVALEETLSEHIASLEADIYVLNPILNIFGLFKELLQLTFAFPCQISLGDDDPACIEASQLAGLVIGRVAPTGRLEPDALLPMAQTYTTIEAGSNSRGNTPGTEADDGSYVGGIPDILREVKENANSIVIPDFSGYEGRELTGIVDNTTGTPVKIGRGGFFSGDQNSDQRQDNVDYAKFRFNEAFEASFGISFTKSKKTSGESDPRIVTFNFDERAITNPLAFGSILSFLYAKKNIDINQTADSPPGFLNSSGNSIRVNNGQVGFISPIDGAADYNSGGFSGFFVEELSSGTYQPKDLFVTYEVEERIFDQNTGSVTSTTREITKTFPNIPMIALIDDEFNLYFIEKTGSNTGGIRVEDKNGVKCITSINAKIVNKPSAPKKQFSKENVEIYRSALDIGFQSSSRVANLQTQETALGIPAGQIIVYEQANANWILGYSQVSSAYVNNIEQFNTDFGPFTAEQVYTTLSSGGTIGLVTGPIPGLTRAPFESELDSLGSPVYFGVYEWSEGTKAEQEDFSNATDSVEIFDFPTLYFVDMRQLSDDIAAACGASGPNDLLISQDAFTPEGTADIDDIIDESNECVQNFLNIFLGETLIQGVPSGIIQRLKEDLSEGKVPGQINIEDITTGFSTLRDCVEEKVQKVCKYVINPLNTSFKILEDIDETPLDNFVDPEQQELGALVNIVEDIQLDNDLEGFPQITGAMEYASGIGDSATIATGELATINIIPRDCYDEIISDNLDLTDSIKIDFIEDETGSAQIVPANGFDTNIAKTGGQYFLAITSNGVGRVKIRATICSVIVKAVADQSIAGQASEEEVSVDCIDNSIVTEDEEFAPGALTKVDRILTIFFTPKKRQIASDRSNEGLALTSPQTFATKLEN
jgi:hypothetical protein